MLYESSHKYICILLPPSNMDIELHVCIFFYELFLGYLNDHHKNIPFKFSMSFLYIFIKTGRQTYIVNETSTKRPPVQDISVYSSHTL